MQSDLTDSFFCRAANCILEKRDLRCESCPLINEYPDEGKCTFIENNREFPDFVGAGRFDEEYRPLQEALQFAAMAHSGVFRKGTSIPYILHPMEAAMIAHTMTDDVEVLSATALHDVIEDTEYTYEDISSRFGERVARLVEYDSENKRIGIPPEVSWRIRKEEGIAKINEAPLAAKQVALGDKLSNMRSTKRDYDRIGDAVFLRFHRKDKHEHAWYYHGLLLALKDLKYTAAYREFEESYFAVYGEYKNEALFQ